VSTHQFFSISELLDTSNRPHHPKRIHPESVDTVQPPPSSVPVRSRALASALSRLTSQFARTTPSPLTLAPWIRPLKDPTTVQQQEHFAAHLCAQLPKPEGEKDLPIMALTEYTGRVLDRRVLHWRGLTLDELRQLMTAAARKYPWRAKCNPQSQPSRRAICITLDGHPVMAEHSMNGFTPYAAWKPLFVEGVRAQNSNCLRTRQFAGLRPTTLYAGVGFRSTYWSGIVGFCERVGVVP
jgi:hypothetical protein